MHRNSAIATPGILVGLALLVLPGAAAAADAKSDRDAFQKETVERLMDQAAKATGRPDHDFAANSLRYLSKHGQELKLDESQMNKVNAIAERYDKTRAQHEAAYKRSELEALKLMHDDKAQFSDIEKAVQTADQEHTQLRLAGIKALREATDVLTPEQYNAWRQAHARRQTSEARSDAGSQAETPAESARIAPHQE